MTHVPIESMSKQYGAGWSIVGALDEVSLSSLADPENDNRQPVAAIKYLK